MRKLAKKDGVIRSVSSISFCKKGKRDRPQILLLSSWRKKREGGGKRHACKVYLFIFVVVRRGGASLKFWEEERKLIFC